MKKEMTSRQRQMANLLHTLNMPFRDNVLFTSSFWGTLELLENNPKKNLKKVGKKILKLENPTESLIEEILSK